MEFVYHILDSPSNDEVRQSDDESANRHQDATYCDDLWSMELGPKVTDKSYHQQITWEDRGSQKYKGFRVLLTSPQHENEKQCKALSKKKSC